MFRRSSVYAEGWTAEELWHDSWYDQDLVLKILNKFNGPDLFHMFFMKALRQLG